MESVCASYGKKGIEDFGYGNGYVYVKEEFGRFLNRLSDLIEIGINVVLTAHAQLRKFEQPDELGAYDRWELKLGKKTQSQTSPLVKEWADMLLFCNYKTFPYRWTIRGKSIKPRVEKESCIHSTIPAGMQKIRYGLPEECELDYSVIAGIIEEEKNTVKAEKKEEPQYKVERPADEKKMEEPFMQIPEGVPEQMEFNAVPEHQCAERTGETHPKKQSILRQ